MGRSTEVPTPQSWTTDVKLVNQSALPRSKKTMERDGVRYDGVR